MSEILKNIASFLGIADIFMVFSIIFNIIRRIFKPVAFKGNLYSFISAFIVSALLFSEIQNYIAKNSDHVIFSQPALFFTICLCSFVLLLFILMLLFRPKRYSIKKLDAMNGKEFEYACSEILKSNGFKNVKVTRASGDYGVDILAEKRGKKYAVQCKRYSHKLGNSPIQEVIGGLAYYDCQKGIVITNSYFTAPAKKLAGVNDIELWDRDRLIKLSYGNNYKSKRKKNIEVNKNNSPDNCQNYENTH